MKTALWIILAVLGLLPLPSTAGEPNVSPHPTEPEAEAALRTLEIRIREEINRIRTARDMETMADDPVLSRVARRYSRAMAEERFFSHTDPQGRQAPDRVLAAGRCYHALAENIAWNFNVPDPAATAIGVWMNSAGHRGNILNSQFEETGVGAWRRGQTYWFTQLFLQPTLGPCRQDGPGAARPKGNAEPPGSPSPLQRPIS